jgi:hypothetical protein
MKIALLLLIASCFSVSGIATGQAVTDGRASAGTPPIYAAIETNRAGISSQRPEAQKPYMDPDSARLNPNVGAHVQNALVGGVLGALTGLAIGTEVGSLIDRRCSDATISSIVILAPLGAIAGVISGLVAGAIWPVR